MTRRVAASGWKLKWTQFTKAEFVERMYLLVGSRPDFCGRASGVRSRRRSRK